MREERINLSDLRFESNRNYGGEGEIKILAEDINRNGLINPITVKQVFGEISKPFEVVAGRRRVAAVTLLGWKDIPCRILEGDEIERAEEIAGSENINRLAMHPLDEAKVFSQLLENGRTLEELAKQYDRKVSEIYQRTQLLNLSPGIKALFRKGAVSLHAAAMLNTLDNEGQAVFCKTYNEREKINDYDVISFISQRQNDRLYKCIADQQCEACKTRTFFKDKTLFPEHEHTSDKCLNHECYIKKWTELLSTKIKNLKAKNKDHVETALLVYHDPALRKILGKEIKIDGVKYTLTRSGYNNPEDKPGKNSKPCFSIDLSLNGVFEIKAKYWKEEKQKKEQASSYQQQQRESRFAPAVRLMGLSKEDAEAVTKALDANPKMNYWEIDGKLKKKHFSSIMEERLEVKATDADVDFYLKERKFSHLDGNEKNIFKLVMGVDYSEKQFEELKKLPKEKLFLLLAAMDFSDSDLPDPEDLESGRNLEFLKWTGISKEKLKELYKTSLFAMIPIPKTVEKPAEAAVKTAKKPSAKKSAKGRKAK